MPRWRLYQIVGGHAFVFQGIGLSLFIIVMVLCLGGILQILGAETTFWNFTGSEAIFTGSLWEGFGTPSMLLRLLPVFSKNVTWSVEIGPPVFLLENYFFFRPPLIIP
jgi:hypothetical protein